MRSCIFTHERRMMMNTKKIKKSVERESRLDQSFQTESKLFHLFLRVQKNQHHHHRKYINNTHHHEITRQKAQKSETPKKVSSSHEHNEQRQHGVGKKIIIFNLDLRTF